MGFNLNDFRSLASKSPLEKIAGTGLTNISNKVSGTLASAGVSAPSILTLASAAADSILSGAASEFFTKNSIARSSINDITQGRFASFLDSKKYSTSVNPEKKTELAVIDNGSSLTYPPDIGAYYIGFTMMDYERPNPFLAAKETNLFNIYLPVPAIIQESHAVSWNEQSVNDLVENAGRAVVGVGPGSVKAQAFANQKALTGALKAIPGIGGGLAQATDAMSSSFQQYAGAIPNPNLSVFFQGPTLRTMQWGWRFHPHNAEESDKIRDIIKQFKKRMLPNLKYSGSSNVLGYPQMVEVKLYPDDYLYQMKKCVITGVTADYAPDGIPQFFEGTKAPQLIDFTIQVKEIEYFLSEDFGGSSGNGIDISLDEIGQGLASTLNPEGDQNG